MRGEERGEAQQVFTGLHSTAGMMVPRQRRMTVSSLKSDASYELPQSGERGEERERGERREARGERRAALRVCVLRGRACSGVHGGRASGRGLVWHAAHIVIAAAALGRAAAAAESGARAAERREAKK